MYMRRTEALELEDDLTLFDVAGPEIILKFFQQNLRSK